MSQSRRKKRKSAKLFVKTVSTMKVYIICIEKSLLKKIIPTTQFKMGLTLILTKEKLNNGRVLLTRFKIRNSKPLSDNSITLTEKLTHMPSN